MNLIRCKRLVCLLLLLAFLPVYLRAQGLFLKTRYSLQSDFLSASSRTPFWMTANQYGEVPASGMNAALKASLHKEYDTLYHFPAMRMRTFSHGYGVSITANTSGTSRVVVPEAYLKIRYAFLEFYAGRRKEITGIADSALSSGSFIWSGNALPLPKIQLSIPEYTPILAQGLISVKGTYAHGWFGSTGAVKHYFLHQKTLYGRLGKPGWRLKMHAGFNHQVQWGGRPATPFYDPETQQTISRFPGDFPAYLKVVSGISLNRGTAVNQPGVPANEALNRAGNHLGTIDLALQWDGPAMRLLLYRQSIYEDGSLYHLSNIADGLLGVSVRNKAGGVLRSLVLEYLHTVNQGGPLSASEGAIASELMGQDNYFNNSLYTDGWTYKGKGIGTPFIIPFSDIPDLYPTYVKEKINPAYLINNRVRMYHMSAAWRAGDFSLISRYAFSVNFGSYTYPLQPMHQHVFAQQIAYRYGSYDFSLMFSGDAGKLIRESYGLKLSIRRAWFY